MKNSNKFSNNNEYDYTPYKKDDFIDKNYEVYGVLVSGGFGIVYLVYSHETKDVHALKTFRDEYLENKATRERFRVSQSR